MKKSIVELLSDDNWDHYSGLPAPSAYEENEEEKEVPPYKIYCDMDGVLTDFESRFEHFTGKHPQVYEKEFGVKQFWHLIDVQIGVRFWVGMDWMPQGKELWSFIQPYGPDLLTSPSRDNASRLGKQLWAKNNLNPKPKVIMAYSKDKQRYANENSILIDDKPSNIEEWIGAGGIAFRVKNGNINDAIKGLKELGYE